MLGAGAGRSTDFEGQDGLALQTASVQYLYRHFAVEGEVAHWGNTWNDRYPGSSIRGPQGQVVGFTGDRLDYGSRSVWAAGVNLLYRSEPRRVSLFVGGGPFLEHRKQISTVRNEGCVAPGFESWCSSGYQSDFQATRAAFHGLTGADVQITGPIRAYVDLRFTTADHAFVQMSGGMRIVALTRRADTDAARRARRVSEARTALDVATTPPVGQLATASTAVADAGGKDVRISLTNGARPHGKFESLTATELSVQEGNRQVRYPLDQILLVETVHHTARKAAIWAAVGGFFGGWLASCGGGDEDDCWPEVGALFGGIGAGAGALIGAGIDSSNAPKHVLYAAPRPLPGVHLIPVVTPGKAGVSVAMRW